MTAESGQAKYDDVLSYDPLGRKDRVQSADGLTTRFSYYAGKVTQDISGSYSDEASSASLDRTREEQHNGWGEVSYSTDSLGNNTYFTYNALGLPATVTGVDNEVSQSLHYLFNDHLGSGSVITDANGSIVETASFDAFGKRRDATSWQGYVNPFSQLPNLQSLLNITQKGPPRFCNPATLPGTALTVRSRAFAREEDT